MDSSSDKASRFFVFPGGIEPEVLAIGCRPVPYARTDEFAAMVLESEAWLLDLLDCTGGRLVSYTASGSAAMEAVVSNLVSATDRVLAVEGGTFGRRWVDMLRLHPHGQVDVEHVPFGMDLDYARMETLLRAGRYRFLFIQHHETSSGARFDVERLGAMCAAAGTVFAVDAIGSFLADDLSMDQFGIDAAVLSSHKGLCLPPGLAFVALSGKALELPPQRRTAYLDFAANLESLRRGHPLFTPAVQIYLQLHRRLALVRRVGADRVIAEVSSKARDFRSLINGAGRAIVPETPSNCLTSFRVRCDARALVARLAADGWFIMPSAEPDQVRVAHLGTATLHDHRELFERILEIEHQLCGVYA
jgi:aspartate aminotransferase-like enzyme